MKLSTETRNKILRGEPIEIIGLPLYPLKMEHYLEWQSLKEVLLLRQARLPIDYISMPFLAALYAMDFDTQKAVGTAAGFMSKICYLLLLALRLPITAKNVFSIRVDAQDKRKLLAINVQFGETLVDITPSLFNKMRPVLAEQNGEKLPDEADNLDLIDTEIVLAASNGPALEQDFNTLFASVAYQLGLRAHELLDWTIYEFSAARAAIERDKMFTICALAEKAGGAKFTKGNPYPSWCLDKKREGTAALESMGSFMSRMGSSGAVGMR